jgi:hypothetical protein
MEKEQASWWLNSYSWFRAQRRTAWELYDKVTSTYGLRAVQEDVLPYDLLPGESWSGWFESSRPVDDKVVALVGFFGPFRRQRPRSFMSHMTMDESRPFLSLHGGEVTVRPMSVLKKRAGWALSWARCFWRLEYLGIVVGATVGALADTFLGTDPLLWLLGVPVGWYLFHLIASRRREGRG